MLIDTRGQGRGEPLIDVWFFRKLFQHFDTFLCKYFLLCFLVNTVQAFGVCLAIVYDINVGLVDRFDTADPWINSNWDCSVDT